MNRKRNILMLALVTAVMLGSGRSVKADFIFGTPTNLGPAVNSSAHDDFPSISTDGLSLFFSSWRPGGSGGGDLWVTTRATIDDGWDTPVWLGPIVNSSAYDGHLSISADGLSLYFLSGRPGGYGSADIWVTRRPTKDDPWGPPVALGPTVNSAHVDAGPSISADGLTLFMHSDRPGGYGNYDLWVTTRATVSDLWGTLVNLGPTVNSSYRDSRPSISADGLALFFVSNQPGGFGDRDLWVTTRATTDDDWGTPMNLGPTVNSSGNDAMPNISADGSTLYFGSTRPDGLGLYDIWQVSIMPVVDLNGDGIVDAADMCIIVDHWGTDEPSCDIGPMPWGDGIVDVQDLIVLAEHLFEDYRLIGHWKLDETEGTTAHDSVGDNDGTLHGNPDWQPTGGKVDGALRLDGIDDYVSTDFVLDPAKGSLSVFAWIKGGAPGQVIISQRDGTGVGTRWLWADSSYGRLITRLMHPPFDPLVSESVITDGQWHHVGLVYDFNGLLRYLYVDGAEAAKDTNPVGGVYSDGGLYFGAGKTLDAGSFFSGLIDDIRIYDEALSTGEVEELAR